MSHYSTTSLIRLRTAHQDLQVLFSEVDPRYPHTVLEGKRSKAQQKKNIAKGVSQTMDSRHLDDPSNAVDAAPDPLRWPNVKEAAGGILDALAAIPKGDRKAVTDGLTAYAKELARWYHFAGYVQGTADQLRRRGEISCAIRWGGDWDSDRAFDDQSFDDLPHFERLLT